MKRCKNIPRRTAISNLTVVFKIPHKVQQTEIVPNYVIEYVPYIGQRLITIMCKPEHGRPVVSFVAAQVTVGLNTSTECYCGMWL
jgi:hypothetical protein